MRWDSRSALRGRTHRQRGQVWRQPTTGAKTSRVRAHHSPLESEEGEKRITRSQLDFGPRVRPLVSVIRRASRVDDFGDNTVLKASKRLRTLSTPEKKRPTFPSVMTRHRMGNALSPATSAICRRLLPHCHTWAG